VKVNNSTVSTQQTNTPNFKPPNTHRETYHDIYMALEIQVLAWDRHKHVINLPI